MKVLVHKLGCEWRISLIKPNEGLLLVGPEAELATAEKRGKKIAEFLGILLTVGAA